MVELKELSPDDEDFAFFHQARHPIISRKLQGIQMLQENNKQTTVENLTENRVVRL